MAAHDPHAQVVRMLDHRQPDRRIVQIKAPAARPPRGIDLECGHIAGLDGLRHLVQPGLEPAEVGCENILQEQAGSPVPCQARGELPGAFGVGEGDRVIGLTGAGHVGEQRNGGVAGEEHVVQIRAAVHAGQRVRGCAVRRDHAEDELECVRRGSPPWQVRHHMMGVDVEDELAAAAQRVLASRDLLRSRNPVAATAVPASQAAPRPGAARGVDRAEQGSHSARALQEPPTVHADPARRGIRSREHLLSEPDVA